MDTDHLKFEIKIEKYKEAVLNNDENYLNDIIEYFFTANKPLPDCKSDEFVKCVTGDLEMDEFIEKARQTNVSNCCKNKIDETDLGFRCKTCSLYPTSVLCMACFQNGNHINHEFTYELELSEICDCSDPSLISTVTNKCNHSIENGQQVVTSTDKDLTKYAEFMLPNMLYRILQYFREEEIIEKYNDTTAYKDITTYNYTDMSSSVDAYLIETTQHFELIAQVIAASSKLKDNLCSILIDKDFYRKKIEQESNETKGTKLNYSRVDEKFSQMKGNMKYPEQLKDLNLVTNECECILDELLLWWIYLKTNDTFSFYLLDIIGSSNDRKEFYAKSYLKKYCFIDHIAVALLEKSNNEQTIFNLFFYGNQFILEDLIRKHHLFETFLLAIYNMIQTPQLLKGENKAIENNYVIDCNHLLVKSKAIFVPLKGIYNIFRHTKMTYLFLSNENLISIWIEFLPYFQGVNPNIRKSEYEFVDNHLVLGAFSFDDCTAAILFSLLHCCINDSDKELTINTLNKIKVALVKWMANVSIYEEKKFKKDHLTFHLVLHRYFAAFLYKTMYKHNTSLKDTLSTDQNELLDTIALPLQIQVCLHEIKAGLWIKNGDDLMEFQADRYISSALCKYSMDADIFLMQCAACHVIPDVFVRTILDRFNPFDICKTFLKADCVIGNSLDETQKNAMIYGALLFLSQLIQREINFEQFDHDTVKYEILQILCFSDLGFSEICETLPNTWSSDIPKTEIKEILVEVADYIKPDSAIYNKWTAGKYKLKDRYWEESYDPLYYGFYRSFSDKYEKAFENYTNHIKSSHSLLKESKLVPPFRLPSINTMKDNKLKGKYNLASSRSLHSVLFILLYKRFNTDTIEDRIFHLAIYLIELALNTVGNTDSIELDDTNDETFVIYKTNNILENLCETVEYINIGSSENSEKKIEINETMISLLIKLLYKTKPSNDNIPIFEFKDEIDNSRVFDEHGYLSVVINKAANLSSKCKEKIQDAILPLLQSKESNDEELQKKKNKAKERQKKILESMSKKQKMFVESTKSIGKLKRKISLASFYESFKEEANATYDCCICQTTTALSLDRPMGIICIVNESSVIGMSANTADKKQILADENPKVQSFFFKEENRANILNELFSSESCKQSVSIGYRGGAYVKTCGHSMHFDCFLSFIQEKEEQTRNFNCPVCRGNANFLIPIKPTESSPSAPKAKKERLNSSDTLNCPKDETKADYIESTLKSDYKVDTKYLKKMMFCDNLALETICVAIPAEERYFNASTNSNKSAPFNLFHEDDAILLLTSLLRSQLEVNNLQNIKTKNSRLIRTCFIPYFQLLSNRCRLLCTEKKPHLKTWNSISKPIAETSQNKKLKKELPVLLSDPISVFLLITLNWPFEIHRNTYQRIVNSVFNLVYIQNILICVSQLNEEQRNLFKLDKNTKSKSFHHYFSTVLQIVERLEKANKLTKDDLLTYNNVKELISYIEKLCLPFLKVASLLQCYLFDEEPEENDSFDLFIINLQIKYDRDRNKDLLHWFEADSTDIMKSWLVELLEASNGNETQIQELLSLGKHIYYPPDLIELPHLYTDFIYKYKNKRNRLDEFEKALNESICLICGQFIECPESSIEHMDDCHNGYNILLFVYTATIAFHKNESVLPLGSLYLDANDEEDEKHKRGEQLFLSQERYNKVKEVWLSHSIDFENSEEQ